MRAWALSLGVLGLAVSAAASSPLSVSSVFPLPSALVSGQDITVTIDVNNGSTGTAYSVSTTVEAVSSAGSGNATLLLSPSPAAKNIVNSGSATFTWVFQSGGCGQVAFSAVATGYDSASGATTTSQPVSSGSVLVNCPSPTFTSTATPVVTATPTSTPTPWIVYVSPPKIGDASIPGNLFHPEQGQPLQLRFDAPAEEDVTIELFNRLGQRVRSITRSVQPGSYTELWDGRNDQGLLVASGIYVAQFRGKALYKTVKFAVIK